MIRYIIMLISFACLASGFGLQAGVITFNDLYSVPRCSDPQISPDGYKIVLVLKETEVTTGDSEKHLWIMNSDGTELRQITFGPGNEWRPRWTPDGESIMFLANRSDTDQVWMLPISGGEAYVVTTIVTGVSSFECSPTGDKLLIVSRVYPDCVSDSCNKVRQAEEVSKSLKAKLYDRLLFRHYNSWEDGKVNRLYIADINGRENHILFNNTHDAPTALLGGYRDYAVAPGGQEVAFAMSTDTNPAVCVNNDLYFVSVSGGEPNRLTDYQGLETSPRYSPDGRWLSHHMKARACYESDQNDLVLNGQWENMHINLTLDFDRSVGEYVWSPDSKSIYFTAVDHGFNKIWCVDVSSHRIELLLGDAVYGDLQVSSDGKFLVVCRSLSDQPYELYRFDLRQRELKRLTGFTDKTVANLAMTRAEEFWFVGALSDSVHGFLTKPPDFDVNKKYPLVLIIHGGPQWCWLSDFNYYGWNTQLVAAQGYVVAQIDPHGSVGYGIEFKEYISGNWGRGDFEDIMKGVDYLVEQYSFIDSTRMAALGRSYGGFLVNWICGHTDRFDCLISIDGTFDHISGYGSTDELWFPEWEYEGTPWTNREEYVRSSPSTYVADFKTPTMIIHGQYDYRVDLSEGLQMFTSLQRMEIPSQFLYFPDEGHNARGVANLRYAYEKQFEWLARWLE